MRLLLKYLAYLLGMLQCCAETVQKQQNWLVEV